MINFFVTRLIISNDFEFCDELVSLVKQVFYDQLVQMYEEIAAAFLQNEGILKHMTGNHHVSIENFESALEKFRSTEHDVGIGLAQNNLSVIYLR